MRTFPRVSIVGNSIVAGVVLCLVPKKLNVSSRTVGCC